MAVVNLAASRLDIVNEPGDDTALTLTVVDADGEPADLDAWSFVAPITPGGEFEVSKVGNVISLSLPADSLAPNVTRQWALVGTAGDRVTTWLAGSFTVSTSPSTRTTPEAVTVRIETEVVLTATVIPGLDLAGVQSDVAWLMTHAVTTDPEEEPDA